MKPIKFETITVPQDSGKIYIEAEDSSIWLSVPAARGAASACLSGPEIQALIDALEKAKQALVEANTLTFADLAVGEFFQWAHHEDGDYATPWICKRSSRNFYGFGSSPVCWFSIDGADADIFGHRKVIRLKATFTPEGE